MFFSSRLYNHIHTHTATVFCFLFLFLIKLFKTLRLFSSTNRLKLIALLARKTLSNIQFIDILFLPARALSKRNTKGIKKIALLLTQYFYIFLYFFWEKFNSYFIFNSWVRVSAWTITGWGLSLILYIICFFTFINRVILYL